MTEFLSIPVSLWISIVTKSKYIELSMLGYILILMFVMRYQVETTHII
uniref:Uncharacterized protein n=1 Tax=Siphoviridae sp. ct96x5 TaxID=2825367 RepID=A0A8S5PQX1_9CAUD|nr:MAG TPA: hypothetical protein [Siphoviridae sp. ct96x5]